MVELGTQVIITLMKRLKFSLLASIWCLMLISYESFSQEKKNWGRPNLTLNYRIGLPDGSTDNHFRLAQSVGITKTFNVSKPVTLGIGVEYAHLSGKLSNTINAYSIGGSVEIYPVYLARLIVGEEYNPSNDSFFVSFGIGGIVNKADFDIIYLIEANLYRFNLGKKLKLSPKISYKLFIDDADTNNNIIYKDLSQNMLGFYSIGIGLHF